MTITAAVVLFAVTWFMVLFIVLPLRVTSQAEAGHVVPGTPPSAPAEEPMRRKLRITTIVAVILWVLMVAVILFGGITIRDLDISGVMDR